MKAAKLRIKNKRGSNYIKGFGSHIVRGTVVVWQFVVDVPSVNRLFARRIGLVR